MSAEIKHDRGRFLGSVVTAIASAELIMIVSLKAESLDTSQLDAIPVKKVDSKLFYSLKQVDTSVFNIGYAEIGPIDGSTVILLHGWPYDIHSYVDIAPILAAQCFRV